MAKYCPKCYAGIGSDDVVCGNCGNVLKENSVVDNEPTNQVSSGEEYSNNISVQETTDEHQDEEPIVQEMIVEEAIIIDEPIKVDPVPNQTATPKQTEVENSEIPMTLGDWLLTLLLLYLPIVNIVMLIIWSVDSNTKTTKKHFAWAALIFMGIGIVLAIIFSSLMFAMIASMMGSSFYY